MSMRKKYLCTAEGHGEELSPEDSWVEPIPVMEEKVGREIHEGDLPPVVVCNKAAHESGRDHFLLLATVETLRARARKQIKEKVVDEPKFIPPPLKSPKRVAELMRYYAVLSALERRGVVFDEEKRTQFAEMRERLLTVLAGEIVYETTAAFVSDLFHFMKMRGTKDRFWLERFETLEIFVSDLAAAEKERERNERKAKEAREREERADNALARAAEKSLRTRPREFERAKPSTPRFEKRGGKREQRRSRRNRFEDERNPYYN